LDKIKNNINFVDLIIKVYYNVFIENHNFVKEKTMTLKEYLKRVKNGEKLVIHTPTR